LRHSVFRTKLTRFERRTVTVLKWLTAVACSTKYWTTV